MTCFLKIFVGWRLPDEGFFLPLHADYYRGLAAVSLRLCVDSLFYVRRKGGPGITDTKPEGPEGRRAQITATRVGCSVKEAEILQTFYKQLF